MRATPAPTVAEQAARDIARLSPATLPASLRRVAEDLVLDIFGLCLAARGSDYARAALAGWDGDGDGTVIGHARRLSAAGAAFVNGTAAHGEDFDDTFEGGPVHAGAVIVPAVLAAAERFRAGGPEALLGIAVGVETICRLSLVAPKRVHQAGFHPTSVFGGMAGGIIEYLADGSWAKRLHPGWAAQAGLQAALLSRAGFTGPRSVFEGTHGLFNGFARGSAGDYGALTRDFGRRWLAETLAFKPYACGTMAHPYIDCAKRLAARGLAAEDVAEILCEVAEGTVHRLWEPLAAKQAPPNAYAAKFSVPFCIAVGFTTGDAGIAAFTAATVADARIRALAGKIRYVVDPKNPYPARYTGHVRATLRDGSIVEERQADLRGGARQPLSRAEIEAKFVANAAYGGWPHARAEAARDLARRLFDGPIDLSPLRG